MAATKEADVKANGAKADDGAEAFVKVSAKSLLMKKKLRTRTKTITIGSDEIEFTYQALPEVEIRKLQDEYPPRNKSAADEGMSFNTDKYPPAFLAKAVTEPYLTHDEWREIWESPDWSLGERTHIFTIVHGLSFEGFDVPFTATS